MASEPEDSMDFVLVWDMGSLTDPGYTAVG